VGPVLWTALEDNSRIGLLDADLLAITVSVTDAVDCYVWGPEGEAVHLPPGGGVATVYARLMPGSNFIDVSAYDSLGRMNSISRTVIYDPNMPVGAFLIPQRGATYSGSFRLTASITNGASNVQQVRFDVDGTETKVAVAGPNNLYTASLDTRTLSEGTHTVNMTLVDTAGNLSYASTTFQVDNTDPVPQPYQQTVLHQATDWQLVNVHGSALDGDGQGYDTNLYVLNGTNGVQAAPLSIGLRADVATSIGPAETAVIILDQGIADEIKLSEQNGALTPALQAIAEPFDPETSTSSGLSTLGLFGRCKDKTVEKSKTFNFNVPLSRDFNLGSGFSGNVTLTGNMQGSGTGLTSVLLKRYAVFGVCIPYGVKFDKARAYGNVQINDTATLNGTLNYSMPPWKKELTKPHLFSLDFAIGVIPVHIGFNLPVTLGVDFQASVTGSVNYNGAHNGVANFDYTCTLDSCSGTSNYTSTNNQPGQMFTGSVSGRLKPSVWLEASVRAYLYGEWLAYAQVGVRPYLYGDLWGFYGNSCGDADGDGSLETVNALTFDLDWQLFITAKARAFDSDKLTKEWNDLWHTPRYHLGFWDLISSNAIRPILAGPASVAMNTSQQYSASMRPCWPYTDRVDYLLAWGDGSSAPLSSSPPGSVSASHSWAQSGTKSVTLTAVRDSHGRQFSGKTTARNIQVTQSSVRRAMTWRVIQQSSGLVLVGSDSQTNPYSGDTLTSTVLPMLCLRKAGWPVPAGLTVDYYHGWTGGEVRLTTPLAGTSLTSLATANQICAQQFGTGYRMAEFHDGGGGWSWWAYGTLNTSTRFWVSINDQPANPWSP
jgi:hypothetical protein